MGVIEKQSIQDIADAIRDRNGLTTLYKPRQMDEAIRGLYKTEAVNHVFDDLRVNTTKENTSFTLDDAEGEAEITELKGNTTQEGTPTPTSPVEVKTVSGDNEVVVSNKNLFKLTPYTDRGITFSQNTDGTIHIEGTATTTYCSVPSNARTNYYLPAGTYTYSKSEDTTARVGLSLYYADGTSENKAITSGRSLTFTTTKTVIQYGPYISGLTANTQYEYNIGIQLEKGTQATDYIAHQGNSYRVDLGGTNKFNYQYSQLRNINRVTTSEETNGFKLISTGASGYGFASLPIDNTLLGKTVTISCKSTGNKTPSARLFYHNSSGSLTSNIGAFWTTNTAHTVTLPSTLPSGATGIDIVFYISQGNNAEGDYATFTNIQIEERKYSNTIQSIYRQPNRTM